MSKKIERILPSDSNAEAAVICAMLIDNESVAKALEILSDKHFYIQTHRIIYQCIIELFEKNIEVDIITVTNRLKEKGELEKIGGIAFINEISDITYSSANLEFHAQIVLEKALLRDLITTANQIIKSCYDQSAPVPQIIDEAEQAIFKIAEMPNRKSFIRIDELLPRTITEIEEISRLEGNTLGIPTGYDQLDRKLGGFRKGQLIIVAARPAIGKSSFVLNIIQHASTYAQKKIALFSLEMSSSEVLVRLLSSLSEVPVDTLLNGTNMKQEYLVKINDYAKQLENIGIFIDESGSNKIMDIRAKSRRLKAEIKALDLIVIDYLQLMSSAKPGDNRTQEITEISRGLKILAKELDVPVIALSQLSREVEKRKDDKRPRLSDLRESGSIEQDADIVLFLHRPNQEPKTSTNPDHKIYLTELLISKNRHGGPGIINLDFLGHITRFDEIQLNEEPD